MDISSSRFFSSRTPAEWSAFVLSKLFILGSTLALLYQITKVNQIYFGYPVVTGVSVFIPHKNMPMANTACIRSTDVLNYERLNMETGRTFKFSTNEEETHFMADNLTVGEILEYTPSEYEALYEIVYRKQNSYTLNSVNGSEITKVFKVEKFVYIDYICYTMYKIDESDVQMSFDSLAVTPVFAGLVYEYRFDKDLFHKADYIKLVMGKVGIIPFRSLMITPQNRRYFNMSTEIPGTSLFNLFDVYQSMLTTMRLPPPYQTKCFNYTAAGLESAINCKEECIQDIVTNATGKLSFTYITDWNETDLLDKQVMSYNSVFNNKTLTQFLYDTENYCFDIKCGKHSCEERTSSTRTDVDVGINDQFTIRQLISMDPWITIYCSPYMSFVEYFTYVTSILATYTGFHFLFMNPFVLFASFREKLRTWKGRTREKIPYNKGETNSMVRFVLSREEKKTKEKLKSFVMQTGNYHHLREEYEFQVLNNRLLGVEELYETIVTGILKRHQMESSDVKKKSFI
jgi:hypothetical protein